MLEQRVFFDPGLIAFLNYSRNMKVATNVYNTLNIDLGIIVEVA